VTNILLSTQGTIGDLSPILRIGSILKARGDSVTMVTHAAYENFCRQAGLDFVASDTMEEFEQYIQGISLCETPQGNIEFQKRHVLRMSEKEVALLTEQCTDPDTIFIGSHMFMLGPQLTAEKMGLPVVRVFPAAVGVARFFLFEIMYGEVLAEEINALRNRIGLPNVSDWAAFARYPQGNIGAWPAWFASPEPDWPEGLEVVLSGFLMTNELKQEDLPTELEDFLQAGEPPVLITGSTGTYLKKGFFAACVEGCQLAGRRAILATRFREAIPDSLPEEIKWFPNYLPFTSLLPRTAAIMHHGGMGTLSMAIMAGTPQLVLAIGSDRPDNAQRLQQLEIGEYLPPSQWKPERIAEALNRLITSPAVQERCREMAQRMRADDPAVTIGNSVAEFVSK
jgi:rhamnosyltransferase subunit B